MLEPNAKEIFMAATRAFLLRTGKAPGRPRQTGQVFPLGGLPL